MYLKRAAEEVLKHILAGDKVGVILGARQVGKTTLVEHVLAGQPAVFLNFDVEVDKARFRAPESPRNQPQRHRGHGGPRRGAGASRTSLERSGRARGFSFLSDSPCLRGQTRLSGHPDAWNGAASAALAGSPSLT